MNVKNYLKSIFKRERKESRSQAALAVGYGGGVWPTRNYATFAKESYMLNAIAFRCIDLISKSAGSVTWKLFEQVGDENTEVFNHPINKLLKRPNPRMAWNYLQYEIMSYLIMSGNSYIEKISPMTGMNKNIPLELWPLRPDRMTIKVDDKTGDINKYVYTVNGQEINYDVDIITGKSDILHLKFFNPLDDFYGMALTEPAAREIDTSNSAIEWNKDLLDNQARPGLLMMFEKNLTDQQYLRLKKDIEDQRTGAKNAGKSMILENARDVRPYGFSPTEMDWINSNLELSRRICLVYGVPAQMIGIPDTSTYANYQEARTSFWEDTVIFYLSLLKSEYNAWIFPDESLFLDYILDDVPAMQYKQELKWKRAQASTFLTENEKRQMCGFDEVDGGDVILVSATMIPLGSEPETETEIEDADKVAKDKLKQIGLGDIEGAV